MTSQEFDSVISKINLSHNGMPVVEIRWLMKTYEYQHKVGNRWQGLPNAVIWTVRNRLHDHYSEKVKVKNQTLKRKEITVSKWKNEIASLLLDNEWFQDFIINGGLCSDHVEGCVKILRDFDFIYKYKESNARNSRKLEALIDRLKRGEFGPSFEFGNFDNEVIELVRSVPWMIAHEQEKRVK